VKDEDKCWKPKILCSKCNSEKIVVMKHNLKFIEKCANCGHTFILDFLDREIK